jgi:hypothetical protein
LKVKADIFYKILLTSLLLIPIVFKSTELNTLISLFVISILIIDRDVKLSKTLASILLSLIVIVIIGVISSFFYPINVYDFFKDFFLFLKPILYILIGYYSALKIKDVKFLFKAIVSAALLFAFIHVFKVGLFILDNPADISRIRNIGGKANFIELFALVIMFLNKKHRIIPDYIKNDTLAKILLSVSFLLYFSRTMFVGALILIFSFNGYLKISKKGLSYMFGIIISVSLLYIFLYSIDLERGAEGIEGFAYKLKIAPTEIFASEINQNNHADLWDHWRGYEVVKAFEQLDNTRFNVGFLNGKGLGSLVDLGFMAPLNRDGIQYIPKIHNGYVNIIFKSGLLGLFFYFYFLFSIYLQAYKRPKTKQEVLFNNIISGIGVYFIFTSFIISGVYNQVDVFTLVLGYLLCLQNFYFNRQNENRNIRNTWSA